MNERNDEAQEFARDRMRQGRFRPAGYSTWDDAMDAARLALPDGDTGFVYKVANAMWRGHPRFVGDQTPYMDTGEDWPGHTSPTAQQVECPTDDHSTQCYLHRADVACAMWRGHSESFETARTIARAMMCGGKASPDGYSELRDARRAAHQNLLGSHPSFVADVACAMWRGHSGFVGDQTAYMDTGDDWSGDDWTGEDWPGHTSPTAQQVECPTDDHSARCYLRRAEAEMQDRASSRDAPDGERSMGRAVAAFNSLYGAAIRARVQKGLAPLDETMGWQFMSVLKKSRGAGGAYREDDYTDDVAYAALAAESAAKENEQ